MMAYLSKILCAYCIEDQGNKDFTLQNEYEILNKFFTKAEKSEYIDSLAVTNIDDMAGMSSLHSIPKQVIKDILMNNTINGILNVQKEYGIFIPS